MTPERTTLFDPTAMNISDTTILALDVGAKRIGVAIKPSGQMMALPLTIVAVTDEETAMQEIRDLISGRQVQVVVVGLPMHQDPAQMRLVKRFTRRLREKIQGVRWRFVDETLTSHAAETARQESGLPRPAKGEDDAAAALILEAFLQKPG